MEQTKKKNKFYLAWVHGFMGTTPQVWCGNLTIDQKPAPCVRKYEISDEEAQMSLDDLVKKYPLEDLS